MMAPLTLLRLLPACRPVSGAYSVTATRGFARPGNGTIAVRRETKNRWERRAPLTPKHVKTLTRQGFRVLVQPSSMRIFTDDMYRAAGALLTEDISESPLIVGVKEVPLDQIVPNTTYMCFSHTIKAQEYNMPLLDAMLTQNVRLIDYERMLDARGKRVIGFGRFAGCAGMIDLLRGLGDRLLGLGYTNPFLGMGYADYYHSLAASKTAVQLVGSNMLIAGMPKPLAPAIFAFTGNGKVTHGAFEIFTELPHEFITVSDLEQVVKSGDRHTVYGVKLRKQDLVEHSDPEMAKKPFDDKHYIDNPHEYRPIFHERVAPFITALFNGMYWDDNYPRLLTRAQGKELYDGGGRLLAIADVSADPNGSVEFTDELTTISKPYLVYNPTTEESLYDWEAPGILLGSVDNLPAELPVEASNLFGEMLLPFIPELARSNGSLPFEQQTDICDTLRNAIITSNGKLTPEYEYIADLRAQREEARLQQRARRALIIGSGMVSGPVVDKLSEAGLNVTVASADVAAAEKLASTHENVTAAILDVNDEANLRKLTESHDIVISLVPYVFHAKIADACIASQTNLITASYISDEMKSRDAAAKAAGITILNEIGLDPGIDHLAAVTMIDEARNEGAQIESFVSWCGGLPSPSSADCPLAYKFSWSPKGVLLAGLNSARFLNKGKVEEIASGRLFQEGVRPVNLLPSLALEGVPNRDSLSYQDIYGLGEATTFLRGTLRYKGFCEVLAKIQELGLLSQDFPKATTWGEMVNPKLEQLQYASANQQNFVKSTLQGLGVLSDQPLDTKQTMIDNLSKLLLGRLEYKEGERDLVLLSHELVVKLPDGKRERRVATLFREGQAFPNGPSAMAETVGIPTALAALAVLDGTIADKGVIRPVDVTLAQKLLDQLAALGIAFSEKREPVA